MSARLRERCKLLHVGDGVEPIARCAELAPFAPLDRHAPERISREHLTLDEFALFPHIDLHEVIRLAAAVMDEVMEYRLALDQLVGSVLVRVPHGTC